MKRVSMCLWPFVLAMLFLSLQPHDVSAIGILAPAEPGLAPLRMVSQSISLDVADQAAKTKISQTFHNDIDRPLEAHYLFPVPKGAQVTDFVLYINGKPQHAEVLERDQARQIYEDIVSRMRDPGLLEYLDRDLFRVRVFPVPPRGDQKVELEYVQVLKMDNGAAEYTFPMSVPGSPTAGEMPEMDFDFSIESSVPIKTIYSPTHEIKFDKKGDKHTSGSALVVPESADKDLTLIYTVSSEDVGLVVLPYRPNASKPGYFSILISPRIEMEEKDIQPKAVTFVIDTSGSMQANDKIEQARNALIYCLNSLREQDFFNVIHFATTVNQMEDRLRPATRDNIREAVKWVEQLRATGGTNIDGALAVALKAEPPEGAIHTIVFMTDGVPTIGPTDPSAILENLDQQNESKLRVFTFGMGYDVNARLLDDIAEQTRSTAQYVRPEEDIEVAVSSFFDKVGSPVLTNLDLKIEGVKTRDVFPAQLPDLFLGSQLVLFGRYEGADKASITLSGDLSGEDHQFVYETGFPEKSERYEYIEPLWAHRKVGYLLDEIRKNGEQPELVDEVVELAKKYAIVTPYTSFLVTEDQEPVMEGALRPGEARPQILRDRKTLGTPMPGLQSTDRRELRGAVPTAMAPDLPAGVDVGRNAVESSLRVKEMKGKDTLAEDETALQRASGRAFVKKDDVWVDQSIEKRETVLEVKFLSPAYFEILKLRTDLKEALALGDQLEIRLNPTTILKIGPSGKEELQDVDRNMLKSKM